jgi:hypothetical protein
MEKLQRRPAEARLAQKLLDCGFSPMLVRKMADGFNAADGDETEWAAQILEKNLRTAAAHESIEDRGGVFALIGATGVGKTTTTAKIAAAFAARHGAANLGLITLDAYRVGAHEQLRAYGRILGVPVHTAHDRASLEDLLDLLTAKKMVLIDTAGMAQRDTRTKELLDMISHRSVQRLLVVNAASQGETIEDVLVAYSREQLRRRRPEQARRGDQARPGARRRDPPQAHRRRRRQRPARPRGLASPVGERAGAAGDARRRQRRLAPRRRRDEPRLRDRAAPAGSAPHRLIATPSTSACPDPMTLRVTTRPPACARCSPALAAASFPSCSNPHVVCGGVLLERLSTAFAERGARVLVVDGRRERRLGRRDGDGRPRRVRRAAVAAVDYLAARGLAIRSSMPADRRSPSSSAPPKPPPAATSSSSTRARQRAVPHVRARSPRRPRARRRRPAVPDRRRRRPPAERDPRLCSMKLLAQRRRPRRQRAAARRRAAFAARRAHRRQAGRLRRHLLRRRLRDWAWIDPAGDPCDAPGSDLRRPRRRPLREPCRDRRERPTSGKPSRRMAVQ